MSVTLTLNAATVALPDPVGGTPLALSDHDGLWHGYGQSVPFQGKVVTLYQHFVGLDKPHLTPLFKGIINDAPQWEDERRRLTLRLTDYSTRYRKTLGLLSDRATFPFVAESHERAMLPILFGRVRRSECVPADIGPVARLTRRCLWEDMRLFVDDASAFPQNTPITIRIQGEVAAGSFQGNTFHATARYVAVAPDRTVGAAVDQTSFDDLGLSAVSGRYVGYNLCVPGDWGGLAPYRRIVAYDGVRRRIYFGPIPYYHSGSDTLPAGTPYSIESRGATLNLAHEAGAEVVIEQDGYIFIVADHPCKAVLNVEGYGRARNPSDGSDAAVPSDFEGYFRLDADLCQVNLNDSRFAAVLGHNVTTLTFPRLPQELWPQLTSNRIWADVEGAESAGDSTGALIENPADVLLSLLTHPRWGNVPAADVEAESFDSARGALASLKMGFALTRQRDLLDLLADLAWQARCALNWDDGCARLSLLHNHVTAAESVLDADRFELGSVRREQSALEDIASEIVCTFTERGSEKKLLLRDAAVESALGRRAVERDFWAYADRRCVLNVAAFWLERMKRVYEIVRLRCWLKGLELQRNDAVSLAYPSLFAAGQGARIFQLDHLPGGGEANAAPGIELTLRLPRSPGCAAACEAGCETGGCETGCEYACELAAESCWQCETSCEDHCQIVGCTTSSEEYCARADTGCSESGPCGACETACTTSCELDSCQTGCQIARETACEVGCEIACETGCQVQCESACETHCQSDCQTSCQSGCELSCETGGCETDCETGCQTHCESACETACELLCQTACQTGCETQCEVRCEVHCQTGAESCASSCQAACESATCQTGCELECEIGAESCAHSCQTGCQANCEVACQASCQLACETGCELECETAGETCATSCQITCETGCQVACETGCQTHCETGCQVACETGCQIHCETGCQVTCETGCQAACQTGCQTHCETGCQTHCETGCQTHCETGCETASQCSFSDDFNRADGAPGANFGSPITFLSGWATGTWAIMSNKLRFSKSGGTNSFSALPDARWGSCGNNYDVAIETNVPASSGGGGVAVRASNGNCYYTTLNDAGSNYAIATAKIVGASWMGNLAVSEWAYNATYLHRANGSSHTVFKNGAQVYTFVDSALGSGAAGPIGCVYNGNYLELDNYALHLPPSCPIVAANPGPDDFVWVWVRRRQNKRGVWEPDLPPGVTGWTTDDSWILPESLAVPVGLHAADLDKVTPASPTQFDQALWNAIRRARRNAYFVADGMHPPAEAHTGDVARTFGKEGQQVFYPGHTWPSRTVPGGTLYYRPRPFARMLEDDANPDAEIETALSQDRLALLAGAHEAKSALLMQRIQDSRSLDNVSKARILLTLRQYGLGSAGALAIARNMGIQEVQL